MPGRKMLQQPTSGEAHQNGPSKFRRTLSNGLAFISNPLAQRKTTPVHHQPVFTPSLAVAAPTTNVSARKENTIATPSHKPPPAKRIEYPATGTEVSADLDSASSVVELDATPRAPPRSRTMSYLPRPARSGSHASVHDTGMTIKIQSVVALTDPTARVMPSKIPSPTPPLSQRRVSSPRQYLPHHITLQEKESVSNSAFATNNAGSPSKVVVRSRTTPSLVNAANSPRPAHYMLPKRPGHKKTAASSVAQKPSLQENIPTGKPVEKRQSQIQEKTLRRESLAAPSAVVNRISFGQGSPLAVSQQTRNSTAPVARKRLSSNLAQQTPITAKRGQARELLTHAQHSGHTPSDTLVAQYRFMGPQKPPTPAPLSSEVEWPPLPRSHTDKDLQRKTLGTPNGLGGIWRSSRALAAANHEVRKLPRSSTFHHFGASLEHAPPVPSIPEQYRTPSLSSLFGPGTSTRSHHARMTSDTASCESVPEEQEDDTETHPNSSHTVYSRDISPELTDSSDDVAVLPPVPGQYFFTSDGQPNVPEPVLPRERPWSISDCHYEDNANVEPYLQVRDYMPPLYWAGRFQSRYDQWRTEAMMAELNPEHLPEGPLGECRLNQEKMAACYIFAQLRDLCLTEQAADSLWEFECKYRKDNKLLGPDYPIHPPRKHDNQTTPKGAFGRAVRKLTPRKSSFVNLLKGKGWGRVDESRPPDLPEPSVETSSSGPSVRH
ncbi:hypothetical protein BDU57DRAFT_488144 [Ampelomyces quisqualis]|uniref:Uncharacterized protein n=1 Tax=Ampelomyces quisqualis TaxID=50730 RepID=A0A6A5R0E3_AMPQU|nr:hypothetical protein BDU57DRAFT_488144 [Ampelomyces quisqualis]